MRPSLADRERCLCKLHENLTFLAQKMKDAKGLTSDNVEQLVSGISCSMNRKECMYLEWQECQETTVAVDIADNNLECEWKQWQTIKEKREIKKGGKTEEKEAAVTLKVIQKGTMGDMNDLFQTQMNKFQTHIFNICHQFKQYQLLRAEMSCNEALVHIDFAENYVAKLSSAIQSAHFGASQHQITLHTLVSYTGPNSKVQTFCSVSHSLQHGQAAIWTHLLPELDDLLLTNPGIDSIHFFSDGPTARYHQKFNFFIFANVLAQKGIYRATWNFF